MHTTYNIMNNHNSTSLQAPSSVCVKSVREHFGNNIMEEQYLSRGFLPTGRER